MYSIPQELAIVAQYARGLSFMDASDYDFVHQTYQDVLCAYGYVRDNVFDWMVLPISTIPTVPCFKKLDTPHNQGKHNLIKSGHKFVLFYM